MRKHGRIEKIRQENAAVEKKMRTFCLLTPDVARREFDVICANKWVQRDEESFSAWKAAVLYKWSGNWFEDDSESQDFITFEATLCDNALKAPTKTIAMKLIYIFYALGNIRHIDLFYQIIGHEYMPNSTRREIAKLYKEVRDQYVDAVAAALRADPQHFSNIDAKKAHVDFVWFDKYDATEAREVREEHRKLVQDLVDKHT